MQATRILTFVGDSYTLPAGNRTVTVTRQELVYRVSVTSTAFGGKPVGDDDRSYATQPEADHYAAQLVQVMTVTTVDVDALVRQINADADRMTAETRTAKAELADDVAQIMAESKGFRGDRPGPRNMTQAVPTTGQYNSPSVAAKPISPESEAVLLAANLTVTKTLPRNADCTLTQILALFNRGLCDPIRVRRGRRHEITGMRLTIKGQRHADHLIAEVPQ